MMKKLLALSVLSTATAATGLAGNTVAETWSPTGTVTLSGGLSIAPVVGGAGVSCIPSGGLTLNGSSATVGSADIAGFLFCGSAFFFNQPYNLEPSSLNSVTLQNVDVAGIFGNCAGDLTGEFDQVTGRITFDNAILPAVSPTFHPCVIWGNLETSPQISYTIP